MGESGRESFISGERVYEGRILSLRVDKVGLPSGGTSIREVIEHKDAVGVLAMSGGNLLLVRQFRYAIMEETIEICAGLIERGESPSDAAVREAREELGLRPGSLIEIGKIYSSPGFCTEALTIFLARDLEDAPLPQDDDENVRTVAVPISELPALLSGKETSLGAGVIKDSKTFAALSWFLAFNK
ncbi:ADP-ribose pyrophosphatase [Synergistales bacterium]|nr:ADP-ribose pyrophosphatase [Synergistales bacterium]